MADTGVSEKYKSFDIQKNFVSQTEGSPKFESSPLNPDFVKYLNNRIFTHEVSTSEGTKTGIIPTSVDLSHLSRIYAAETSYPAYYDLRTLNRVTNVKNQGTLGTCWTFATYGSLESSLMPGEKWDFSENNMKNQLSSVYPEGFDDLIPDSEDTGGSILMSMAYLARWSGPVNETDDPYSLINWVSPNGLTVTKHVQDVHVLPIRKGSLDNDNIKWAIQNYGGVFSGMYFENTSDYYKDSTYSYYYGGIKDPNHAVTIVGWDDNYDKNKFEKIPPGDGAFIVKNSYGTDFGEKGYFYVSYYDYWLGSYENTVFTAERSDNYNSIYQYDPLGWINSIGFFSPSAWCANIFTAKSKDRKSVV